jgi:UDP-GlcNAc:undecaprenyl-phosphate GlcNAc-1-phosphate transferase
VVDLALISLLAIPLAASVIATPVARRIGGALGLLDHPHHRKVQRTAVPRTGGIGIVAGLGAGLGVLVAVSRPLGIPVGRELLALCAAGAIIHVIGILDDLWDIPAPAKLLAQSAAVGVIIANGVVVREVSFGPGATWSLGILAVPLTAFFVLGFVNALNLVDGLDGLASGIAAVGAFALAVTGVLGGNIVLAGLAMPLLGAVLGFLPYNFDRRRKTFLGDAGSMLLGYSLAAAAIHGSRFANGDAAPLLVALGCGFIPILDTATTIVRRFRQGHGLFRPDSMHLHHRLIRFGLTPSRAVATLVATTIVVTSQLLAYLLDGLPSMLAVSLLAAAFVTVGLRFSTRPERGPVETDPSFREIVFYLLGARDGHTPRLRGELPIVEILARDRAGALARSASRPAAPAPPAAAPADAPAAPVEIALHRSASGPE